MCSTKAPDGKLVAPSFQIHAHQVEKLPPCQAQCPNSGDIRGWLGVIAQHHKNGLTLDEAYDKAWGILTERNPLPATIARICPHPCEDLCSRNEKDGAVSINAMERFLGDWGLSRSLKLPRKGTRRHAESIAAVGSGPASLSFAYQMARRGYDVTIYEQATIPGGMLRQAIPDYRLPREVLDAEVERMLDLNISFVWEADVGGVVSLEELRGRHALVFLGLGAQSARQLGIPGENGPGVSSGIDYLRQRKQQPQSHRGERVVVIGGGNTAIDTARCARRDGADVTVLYRRSEAEMPAAAQEVDDARTEGVQFRFLVAPAEIVRDGGRVQHVVVQPMHLGEPGAGGRRRPIPSGDLPQEVPADLVIVAVAQAPDWQGMGALATAEEWLHANTDGKVGDNVWAGGDARGPGLAGAAIAHGRFAAEAAHAELRGLPRTYRAGARPVDKGAIRTDHFAAQERSQEHRRPPEEWLQNPEVEIDQTITYEQAHEEAARCMSCGLCFDCQQCFMYCNGAGFTRIEETSPGNYFALALDACEGCGKCIEICPCGYIESRQ